MLWPVMTALTSISNMSLTKARTMNKREYMKVYIGILLDDEKKLTEHELTKCKSFFICDSFDGLMGKIKDVRYYSSGSDISRYIQGSKFIDSDKPKHFYLPNDSIHDTDLDFRWREELQTVDCDYDELTVEFVYNLEDGVFTVPNYHKDAPNAKIEVKEKEFRYKWLIKISEVSSD